MPRKRGSSAKHSAKSQQKTATSMASTLVMEGSAAGQKTWGSNGSEDLSYLHKKFKKIATTVSCAVNNNNNHSSSGDTSPELQEKKNGYSHGTEVSKAAGRHVCPYCRLACAKPSVLQKHIRAHTNERPYPCEVCGIAFKTKSNLYKHCKSRAHAMKLEGNHVQEFVSGDSEVEEDEDADVAATSVATTVSSRQQPEQQPQQHQPQQLLQPNRSIYKPKFHMKNFTSEEPLERKSSRDIKTSEADAHVVALHGPHPSPNQEMLARGNPEMGSVSSGRSTTYSNGTSSCGSSNSSPGPSSSDAVKKINRLISENEALLETTDPQLTRRSRSSNSSPDSRTSETRRPLEQLSPQPLNLSVDDDRRQRCTSDPLVAKSVVRELLTSSKGVFVKTGQLQKRLEALPHPQNPEGSIIKDLLLKSRGSGVDSQQSIAYNECDGTFRNHENHTAQSLFYCHRNAKDALPAPILINTSEDTYETSQQQLRSPGPTLGGVLLVENRRNSTSSPVVESCKRKISFGDNMQHMPLLKKRILESTDCSIPCTESVSPRPSPSLQMSGGEVRIREGKETRTIRIESGVGQNANNSVLNNRIPATPASPSHVVVKCGLHSGGSIMLSQPQQSAPVPSIVAVPTAYQILPTLTLPPCPNVPLITQPPVLPYFTHKSWKPNETVSSLTVHTPTYVPGIPGPHSLSPVQPLNLTSPSKEIVQHIPKQNLAPATNRKSVPVILVQPSDAKNPVTSTEQESDSKPTDVTVKQKSGKFLRPTSLPLKPGTFLPKKHRFVGSTLVSPETPRPRKAYGQLYLNGHAYTYLGLKCSTRVHFCCLHTRQPIYAQSADPLLSMYSKWQVRPSTPDPFKLSPSQSMALYDSHHRMSGYTTASMSLPLSSPMITTHSSYWEHRDNVTNVSPDEQCVKEEPKISVKDDQLTPTSTNTSKSSDGEIDSSESVENPPKRVKIFAGGFESNEAYTYVRGRGRGRYVCEECGIRCRKPSMLKKHLRTHTDVRPFACRHCNFSFKTKGNLTKHMKSKAHHKKCVEMGIVPVPTTVDDSQIDAESLAKLGSEGNRSECDSETDEDDDEDEEEDEEDEECTTSISQSPVTSQETVEVARSLLDLSASTATTTTSHYPRHAGLLPLKCKLSTYPYSVSVTNEAHSVHNLANSRESDHERVCENTVMAAKEHGSETSKQETFVMQGDAPRYYFTSRRQSREEPDTPQPQDAIQPIDLSRESVATPILTPTTPKEVLLTPTAAMLASIYETACRVPTTPVTPNEDSPMLQAYLTARALRENSIKQHQVGATGLEKIFSPAPSPGTPVVPKVLTPSSVVPQTSSSEEIEYAEPETTSKSHSPPSANSVSQPNKLPASSLLDLGESSAKQKNEFYLPGPLSGFTSSEDGKSVCNICLKVFSKPSHLRLHVNIHYFERPFRCEACAVSFRTKGHLQKHKRSVSHSNKVSMNQTFGMPTTDNPRPFKCEDCKIAFRIHGHLAKHLRSKMHIMKLECLGKLPFGTYAEIERSGANLNEIDTTDCDNSLESLQVIATKLHEKEPLKVSSWERERTISSSSEEMGEPYDEADVDTSRDLCTDEGNSADVSMNYWESNMELEPAQISSHSISTDNVLRLRVSGKADESTCRREICGSNQPSQTALQKHMVIHAHMRSHVCRQCDAGFSTSQHLENHMLIHQNKNGQ